MSDIKKFSKEVCDELQYYVYRLIDPNNGQTFYVGQGNNNRVFAHVNCALKNFEGENYLSEEDDEDSLKLRRIREIKSAGLDVIHVIQKYGLTKEQALLIESVLIDVYDGLTNKVRGFGSDECPINAITLEKNHSIKEFNDMIENPKYIIIKVKEQWVNQSSLYEIVRSAWKLNIERVRSYPYVLAVVNGIVKEVYLAKEWHNVCGSEGRIEFTGEVAEESVRNLFINKKIPARFRKKGSALPTMYSD